jgi:glycosyltransferase involved in cell wall biosynthesis
MRRDGVVASDPSLDGIGVLIRYHRRMRITHVVVSLDPNQGGLPAVATRLAAAQAAPPGAPGGGHDVSLVCHQSPGREDAVQASLRTIPGIERVKIITVPAIVKLGLLVPKQTHERLREQLQQTDVAHLHGLWEALIRAATIEARKLRVPFVLTPHGMLDPWSLRQRWLKKKIALALTYRKMINNAARLHVLNDDEARLIEPLRLKPPLRVIANGVFLEEIEPLPERGQFRASHPDFGNDAFVLFLSRLHYKKGLDYLADAFAMLAAKRSDVRLVIAGPDGGAQADFEQRVKAAGIADRVHVVGPLWGPEKFAAMVDAACFCLPSRQEGFSMAITESLACGTPAVVSEACHYPEVATSGAGEVVPLDSRAVAEALERVLADESRRIEMGRRGRALVLNKYTWPVIAQKAVEMYDEVRR